MEKGEKIGLEKVARKLLADGMEVDYVCEMTGLAPETVQSFKD